MRKRLFIPFVFILLVVLFVVQRGWRPHVKIEHQSGFTYILTGPDQCAVFKSAQHICLTNGSGKYSQVDAKGEINLMNTFG